MDWIVKTIDKFKAGMGTMPIWRNAYRIHLETQLKKQLVDCYLVSLEEGKEGGAKNKEKKDSRWIIKCSSRWIGRA